MKFSEDICFSLPRSRNEFYVVVKKNAYRIDGGRCVLTLLKFRACGVCFMQRPPYFRFGKIVIFSKDSIDSE